MSGENFRIDVQLDPAPAIAGIDRIRHAIVAATSAANGLRAALRGVSVGGINGGRTINNAFNNITNNINNSTNAVNNFNNRTNNAAAAARQAERNTSLWAKAAKAVATAYAGIEIGTFITDTLDKQTDIQNKLKVQTSSLAEQKALYKEIVGLSNTVGVNVNDFTKIYARFATVLKPVGLSQNRILKITDTLTKSFIVQGSTAQEAASGVTQLSQAFSKGILDGEELKAVLEGNAIMTQSLAEAAKVEVGQLKELGAQGKLTMDVLLKAIEIAAKRTGGAFAKMKFKISQSLAVVQNEWGKLVNEMDESLGITDKVSEALKWVAANMEDIVRVAGALATVFGVKLSGQALSFTISQFTSLNSVLRLLRLSFLGTAVGILAFSDRIPYTRGSVATLEDALVSIPDALGIIPSAAAVAFGGISFEASKANLDLNQMLNNLTFDWEKAIQAIGVLLESLITGVVSAVVLSVNALTLLATAVKEKHTDLVDRFANDIATLDNTWENLKRGFKDYFGLGGPYTPVDPNRNKVINNPDPYKGTKEELKQLIKNADLLKKKLKDIQEGKGITNQVLVKLRTEAEEEYKRRVAELEKQKKLLEEGKKKLDEAGGADGTKPTTPADKDALKRAKRFAKLLDNLKLEGELLKLNNEQLDIQGRLLEINNQFEGKLSKSQLATVEQRLKRNQSLREQRDLYNAIESPLKQMHKDLETLKKLRDTDIKSLKISNAEYEKHKKIIEEEIANTQREEKLKGLLEGDTVAGGLEAGMMKVAEQAKTTSELVAESFESAFNKATDALAKFVETGKLDFAELTRSILADISKMALKSAMSHAVGQFSTGFGNAVSGAQPAGGGGGGGDSWLTGLGGMVGAFFGGGFATGGSMIVGGTGGTDSQLVSLRATPGERIDVTTPHQQQQMAAPAPPPQDISIINVPDPKAMGSYLNTSEGRKVIFNVVEANKTQFKRMLES